MIAARTGLSSQLRCMSRSRPSSATGRPGAARLAADLAGCEVGAERCAGGVAAFLELALKLPRGSRRGALVDLS